MTNQTQDQNIVSNERVSKFNKMAYIFAVCSQNQSNSRNSVRFFESAVFVSRLNRRHSNLVIAMTDHTFNLIIFMV